MEIFTLPLTNNRTIFALLPIHLEVSMLPTSNELITFVPHATQGELSMIPTANNPNRVSLLDGQGKGATRLKPVYDATNLSTP